MTTRIELLVQVNLDPVHGTFHEPRDFQKHIQRMLTDAFPWYDPTVAVVAINSKDHLAALYAKLNQYVDRSGMPLHLPLNVNADNEGPEDEAYTHHYTCWCGQSECAWNKALTFNLAASPDASPAKEGK